MSTERTLKREVRSDFRHARYLMALADQIMKQSDPDLNEMQAIANELLACTATFSQWVEEQNEEATA